MECQTFDRAISDSRDSLSLRPCATDAALSSRAMAQTSIRPAEADRADMAHLPGSAHATALPAAAQPAGTLLRIASALPPRIFCFSACGMASASMEVTALSIEPSRCG